MVHGIPCVLLCQASKSSRQINYFYYIKASDCLQKGDRGQTLISLIVGQGCKNTKVPNIEESWYLLIREQGEKTCKKKKKIICLFFNLQKDINVRWVQFPVKLGCYVLLGWLQCKTAQPRILTQDSQKAGNPLHWQLCIKHGHSSQSSIWKNIL